MTRPPDPPPEASSRGSTASPSGDTRIDQAYYDSDYFQAAGHLADADSRFHRYRIQHVLALLRPVPADRVVDLGCGWGTITFALAPRVAQVIGVDYSERSVALCEERLAREPHTNLRFVQADARATGLPDGAFDAVVAADLYEHLYPEDSEAVTAEAHRLLAPGGRLVIWTPHQGHALEALKARGILLRPDPSHVDYKSMERLVGLCEQAGFQVERATWAPSHLPVLSWLEGGLQRWVPPLRRRICVVARKG